jgi:hypothetical protein
VNWALFILAGLLGFGLLVFISQIGKPREPIAPDDAVATVVFTAAVIVMMILAGVRLT